MKKFFQSYNNLKLRSKIIINMISITSLSLLFISIMSYNYFASVIERDAKENTKYSLEVATQTFADSLNSVLRNTNRFISNNLSKTLQDIENNNQQNFINNYIYLQNGINSLINSSDIIDSLVILGKNGEFFSVASIGIKYDFLGQTGWNLSDINDITLLGYMKNPVTKINEVLPLVIPISNQGSSKYPIVAGSVEDALATIIIFLNNSEVNKIFNQINNNKGSTIYLADSSGHPLTISHSNNYLKVVNNKSIIDHVSSTTSEAELELKTSDGSYIINSNYLNTCNLRTVNIISKDILLKELGTIKYFIIITWLVSCLLTITFSLLVAKALTTPLNKLIGVVNQIKDSTYNLTSYPKYNDEIGFLHNEINAMYETILVQIDRIKKEEKQNLYNEITILTDQLNPHFLYNTLDGIRWEILSGDKESSATMIEALAQFLRIQLDSKNLLISIEEEIKHTKAYLEIMNHRSNQNVEFSYQVDKGLRDFKILRLTLQPLVENSIKHGFSDFKFDPNIYSYNIDVDIRMGNHVAIIEVSDNGKGIDIRAARESLKKSISNKRNHIGLKNVYQRLLAHYGRDVHIDFISVPYVKNSVIISIPLDNY